MLNSLGNGYGAFVDQFPSFKCDKINLNLESHISLSISALVVQ